MKRLITLTIALLLLLAGQASARNLDQYLVAHWPGVLDDAGLLWDREGGNDGTITGATPVDTPRGMGLSFDGGDDVDCGNPSVLRLLGSMTVAGWFKPEVGSGADHALSKSTTGDLGYRLYVDNSAGLWRFRKSSDGASEDGTASATVQYGVWQHIAGVFDAGSQAAYIYFNGTLVGTDPTSGSAIFNSTQNVHIGTFSGINGFTGQMDDTRIYSTTLTANEVEDLAKQPPLSCPVVPTGKMENQLYFDGTDDYLYRSAADWRSSDSAGTIYAWVRSFGASCAIWSSCDEASDTRRFILFVSAAGKLSLVQRDNDTADQVTGNTTINDGKTHFVAAVSDDSQYFLLVDDAWESLTVDSGTNSGDWLAETTARDNIGIGVQYRTGPGLYFEGFQYECGYYSVAKTLGQLQAIRGYDDRTGLISHWPLDEPLGQSVRDTKGGYDLSQTTRSSQPAPSRGMSVYHWDEPVFREDWSGKTLNKNYLEVENSYASSGDFNIAWIDSMNFFALACVDSGAVAIQLPEALTDLTKKNIRAEVYFYKGTDAGATRYYPFFDSSDLSTGNGYRMQFGAAEAIRLIEIVAGSPSLLARSATGYKAINTWYKLLFQRTYDGDFTLYVDDVIVNTAGGSGSWPTNDVTTTTVWSQLFELSDGDMIGPVKIWAY